MKDAQNMDSVDGRILAELQRDGRATMADLAPRVGLTPTPCLRRVKRLEAEGIIKGYAAIVDPAKVGRQLQAFVEVKLQDHADATVQAFRKSLQTREEVVACYFMTGEIDFLLHVMVPDLETFSRFSLKVLLKLPGVKDSRSSFVLDTLKPAFVAPMG
jgi:Lrp/AsnC family leucine-responsive transcriptional regulator